MLQKVMHNFDNILGVAPVCMKHTKSSDDKMVKELNKASVFDYVEGRHHQCFPKIVANVFSSIDQAKLHKWMNKQFQSQLKESFLNQITVYCFHFLLCMLFSVHVRDYFKYIVQT